MILLNFAHPMTDEQRQQIETLTGQPLERVITVHSQIDLQQPLVPQVVELVDQAGLSPAEWQNLSLLVNPPSLASSATTLLAELHGRCGYFPTHLRMRPVQGALPPRYEVAEIIDLQAVCEHYRVDIGKEVIQMTTTVTTDTADPPVWVEEAGEAAVWAWENSLSWRCDAAVAEEEDYRELLLRQANSAYYD